jgi:hypothetical protein
METLPPDQFGAYTEAAKNKLRELQTSIKNPVPSASMGASQVIPKLIASIPNASDIKTIEDKDSFIKNLNTPTVTGIASLGAKDILKQFPTKGDLLQGTINANPELANEHVIAPLQNKVIDNGVKGLKNTINNTRQLPELGKIATFSPVREVKPLVNTSSKPKSVLSNNTFDAGRAAKALVGNTAIPTNVAKSNINL